MLRQLLLCLVLVVAAACAWFFFVPNSRQTLAGWGISVPGAEIPATAQTAGAPSTSGAARPPGAGNRPQGAGGGAPRIARANTVVTGTVSTATINDTLTAIGEGLAARSVTVTSPSGGELVELLVSPGDDIEAGEIVGRLDAVSEQITYDQASLALVDAQATLTRTQGLSRSNVVADTAVTAAQLAFDTAQLQMRTAEVALGRRSISSPIAGTVGLMQVTAGNYLTAQTAVTTVDDTSSIEINFWVPERYAAAVKTGMPVVVSAVSLPDQVFTGDISAVDNRIDSASKTLQVRARIPNESGTMRAGMSFSVTLKFTGETFPSVNPLAIQWSAEGSYVWKYLDGKVHKTLAKIIQRNSDGVLVTGDLKTGDAIVTEGVLQLTDGSDVTLIDGPAGNVDAAPTAPTQTPTDAPVETTTPTGPPPGTGGATPAPRS